MTGHPQDQMGNSDIAIDGNFICPQTHQILRKATSEELAALQNLPGLTLLEAAWATKDSATAYPVQNGIPQLIPSAAIAIPKLTSSTP
jgi:uncharacterized protein YbaR (Trm112 family)